MRINSFNNSFPPIHIARAYGLEKAAAPPLLSFPKPEPMAAPRPAGEMHNLVAATVQGTVNFDHPPQATGATHSFQMYTRAADKIEAAVAVQVGRVVDLKG